MRKIAEREAAQRRGDDFDFAMIIGLRDQQSGDQRTEDGAETDRPGREARQHHDEKTDGEEQLGALGPGRLSEQPRQQEPADQQQRADDEDAADKHLQQGVGTAFGVEQQEEGYQAQVLQEQDGERGLSGTSWRSRPAA